MLHKAPVCPSHLLGVRRENDFHSKIIEASKVSGIALFPRTHGDLMYPAGQGFWLDLSARGAVHFILGGPPCETWSVSRWRYYDTGEGPQPLRSGEDTIKEIWGWATLRIRDLRQLIAANALLLFTLRLFVTQLLSGGGGLIEHPARPSQCRGRQPPSIWFLPLISYLLTSPKVRLIQLFQGYWTAVSPNPTSFMVTSPAACGRDFQ